MLLRLLASLREKTKTMADISCNFLGIKSPNPFWLASAPPTDKKYNVLRALEAGWGGIVWKTLGSQVKNVSSRYSAMDFNGTRVMGFNNIELISDRPLDINLKEIGCDFYSASAHKWLMGLRMPFI